MDNRNKSQADATKPAPTAGASAAQDLFSELDDFFDHVEDQLERTAAGSGDGSPGVEEITKEAIEELSRRWVKAKDWLELKVERIDDLEDLAKQRRDEVALKLALGRREAHDYVASLRTRLEGLENRIEEAKNRTRHEAAEVLDGISSTLRDIGDRLRLH